MKLVSAQFDTDSFRAKALYMVAGSFYYCVSPDTDEYFPLIYKFISPTEYSEIPWPLIPTAPVYLLLPHTTIKAAKQYLQSHPELHI